jgi:stage II sporulation protein P
MSGYRRKKLRRFLISGLVVLLLAFSVGHMLKKLWNEQGGKNGLRAFVTASLYQDAQEKYFLLPLFLEEKQEQGLLERTAIGEEMLLYAYLTENVTQQEGTDEDTKNIDENSLDYGKDALHIENSIVEEMERENRLYQEAQEKQEAEVQTQEEQQTSFQAVSEPVFTYDWTEEWEYEDFVSNFYAVDNTTSLQKEYLSLDKLLYQDLKVDTDTDGPQILIYHTHSQEAFADSVPGDASTTIVGAGERLAELLTEEYGFSVLHHKGEYDLDGRAESYNNALPELEKILAENPTIEVVIDLHRDEMKEDKKLVIDLQGKPTARFMFFNGMSYIRDKGEISYLENPYIQENLAFSFQAQVAANEYYPGIARKIYLKAYRYNLHLKPKSLLIELGAQTNTVEEIMNACEPLAHIISVVLSG